MNTYKKYQRKYFVINLNLVLTAIILGITINTSAQVGIGTTTPDASSVLDIQSTSKGFLAPRMTTVERTAISTPVVGLMVFDTDLNKFYFYDGSSWIANETNQNTRDNYVLVKTLADFPTPSAGTITLASGTLYEVNGTIALGSNSIDLNGCFLTGADPSSDILTYTGATGLFSGANGGQVEFLNIQGSSSKLFNITDGTNTKIFIIRDCFVSNFSDLGTISGHDFVFFNSLQYTGNTTGITFSGVNELFLNSQIWGSTNSGTIFTFNGSFEDISIVGGELEVNSGEKGIDVTANPTVANGLVQNVTFAGVGTFIDGYTVGSYSGFHFTNDWHVSSSGILKETDDNARGDINLDAPVGSGFITTFTGSGVPKKLVGTSTSNNLFRFTKSGDNKIVYDGKIKRSFSITAAASFQGNVSGDRFIFYIAKNGIVATDTKVYRQIGTAGDIGAIAIVGVMDLSPADYIEVWVERFSGTGSVILVSLNLIAN
ncbi:MAG: hypothetical protein QM499_09175 [Flavobacteriaceae bacterium]